MTPFKTIHWWAVKLPLMLMLMLAGFALEAVITFPFFFVYQLDRVLNKKDAGKTGPMSRIGRKGNKRAGQNQRNATSQGDTPCAGF